MNVGDKAPEILGTDQDGKEIKLSDYKGKKYLPSTSIEFNIRLYSTGLQPSRQLQRADG